MVILSATAPLTIVAVEMAKTYWKNQVWKDVDATSCMAKDVDPARKAHINSLHSVPLHLTREIKYWVTSLSYPYHEQMRPCSSETFSHLWLGERSCTLPLSNLWTRKPLQSSVFGEWGHADESCPVGRGAFYSAYQWIHFPCRHNWVQIHHSSVCLRRQRHSQTGSNQALRQMHPG